MTEDDIIRKLKRKIENLPPQDLSDEEKYERFSEELSRRATPKIEALDRLMKNSVRAYAKPFG